MLYAKFIQLVEDHAEELTKRWTEEVKKNPATTSYKTMSDDLLVKRIFDLYKKLHYWIMQNDPGDMETGEFYLKLGSERASENIKLSELLYAILLSRVVLWRYILNQGIINNAFDLQQAFEFFQRVNSFYDKVIYLVSIGHESYIAKERDKIHKREFIEKTVKSVTNWLTH
ncbi:MAG: hypothetical protein JW995_02130 [Melioribacteraceae bacterium]|nr:hypothetical protein [Melioribacteraceae bacterium]